jgi:glycosyltransferase involved in cell wall biosynthesis
MTLVSVVVCTRGRPDLLRRSLESLDAQTLPRTDFEVVVVDNGDGDGARVAAELCVDRALREPSPGLSRARNAGWRASRSELVGFLDDDAEAEEHWLERALRLASQHGAGAVGGPIVPVYDESPPHWFRDEYEQRAWGPRERPLLPGESLSGSNLLIRRKILEALGGFDERLGMRGAKVAVGEETALFEALWRAGDATVLYSPSLVVRHRVAPEKLSVRYQLRRSAAAGESWAMRQDLRGAARVRRGLGDTLAVMVLVTRALVRLRRPVFRWAVDELSPAAARLGSLRGLRR